ncbi:TetR/AcrR family transcriptional regulator [Paenibacillus athensensis]|uniref:TetR/AcrR family transcriptional regulator n=1 Tax=Paenibacillus athensensis TaxID=1967502 RepID=UPI00143164D4|nr:TetR/AcrR family transcriptional regulator [Paenibacillus athensensis]MCD1260354.1 TetR/AcrR family transcriptional regulator [Paenibacillus athensensis]
MEKNKFQLKREATHRQLLEAGQRCFADKGFASTTIGDIVARTGHTNGAFYAHFKTKEELFLEVLDYQLDITKGWSDVPRDYSPADTTLEAVITATVQRLGELLMGVDNWIVALVDFYQQTKHDPAMRAIFREKYGQWIAGIENLVRNLQTGGWIAADADVRQLAMQVIAFNEGYTIFSALFGGTDPQALIGGLVKLLR